MKVLVIYASAGAGHRRSAEAIYEALQNKPHIESTIIDALDYTHPFFKKIYAGGYFFLIRHAKWLWCFFYHLTDNPTIHFINNRIRNLINRFCSGAFREYIKKEKPDIVVTTHFLANEIVAKLKSNTLKQARLICIVTDLSIHSFWINSSVDEYIVGLKETKEQIIGKGINPNKIKVLGIPVDLEFYSYNDKNSLSRKIEINPNIFTALIVTGTIGIGPIRELAGALKDKMQLLVICGKNKKLYSQLKNIKSGFIKIYGLVKNMDELMAVSDIVITKAGGLTIAESLAMNLPMIFISIIPGQEAGNAKIITEYGIGFIPSNTEKLINTLLNYQDHPEQLDKIRERIRSLPIKNATENIINEICAYSH